MLDVKGWLEATGEPVEETCFPPGEVPSYPYIVYLDNVKSSGADMQNLLKTHSLTIERYSSTNDDNLALEALLNKQAIEHEKEKQWLRDEECYMTTYNLEFIEKI